MTSDESVKNQLNENNYTIGVFSINYNFNVSTNSEPPALGGDATGRVGLFSYSVGQLVYTTNTDTGGTVTEGVIG